MNVDGVWLRRLAFVGARYGPRPFLEHAPPVLGGTFFALLPSVRRRIIDNLRLVLGERDPRVERRDALKTFANFASCLAETMALEREEAKTARLRVEQALGHGEVSGVDLLEARRDSGRGLIVVTAHVGPFEAAASCLARNFQSDVLLVMAPEPNARARDYHDDLRRRHGVRVAHVGAHETDALVVLSHLRAGGVAALQIDRPPGPGRVFEKRLFGSFLPLPEGPFRLAGLAQVPIVSVFASRSGVFDYALRIGSPIELGRRPAAGELDRAADQVLREMERAIVRDPTQWFHFEAPGK